MRALLAIAMLAACGGGQPNCDISGYWAGNDATGTATALQFKSGTATILTNTRSSDVYFSLHGSTLLLECTSSSTYYTMLFDRTCQAIYFIKQDFDDCKLDGTLFVHQGSSIPNGKKCKASTSGSCTCDLEPVAGPNTYVCGGPGYPGAACCADSGWPTSSTSTCSCNPLRCHSEGVPLCRCDYSGRYSSSFATVCSAATVCCVDQFSNSCYCKDFGTTCDSSTDKVVTSCDNFFKANDPAACPQMSLATCS
jgi:hypothetical protein